MADTRNDFDKMARASVTMLFQVVALISALLVTYWAIIQPYTGEQGPPDVLGCLLFIGGIYAMTGAVIRVLAHKHSDRGDYVGKQLGLAGATVALIGATTVVPAFLFLWVVVTFVAVGIVLPVVVLAARWLSYRPADCSNDTVRKKAPKDEPTSPEAAPVAVPEAAR